MEQISVHPAREIALYLEIQDKIRRKYQDTVKKLFTLEVGDPAFDFPPRPELGSYGSASIGSDSEDEGE